MIEILDLLRARILKETAQFSFLRDLIYFRSKRIFFLAAIAIVFYFFASLFVPLHVLLVGPILWGIPHILSSLRYNVKLVSDSTQKNKIMIFQATIWLIVFSYRLSIDYYHKDLFLASYPLLFEGLCLLAAVFFQTYIIGQFSLKTFLHSATYACLIFFTYKFPIQSALTLLIGHNYIPLINWYKSCQDREDLRIFICSAVLYVGLSVLILFGTFDFLYTIISPVGEIRFFNWNYFDVVSPFGATSENYKLWFHIVSLYAFSQAVHYFIWMKAIPENHQAHQFPPTFSWSLKKLNSDFGTSSIYLLGGLVVVGTMYWLFFEFQQARLIYFSIASYHGFMELSAIPFLKSNRKNKLT